MYLSKKTLILSLFVFAGLISAADDYLETVETVSKWIDEKYSHERTKETANKKVDDIIRKTVSDAEKIRILKQEFPGAFLKEEKPLIFVPLISWRIHSLALGYDIQENAAQTTKTIDIGKDISEKKGSSDSTKQDSRKSVHKGGVEVSANAGISANPFSWLSDLKKTRINLSGSYSYGHEAQSSSSELWSESKQAAFKREQTRITEMIAQTNIKNFHLSFTVTITNNSKESIFCNLKEAYIPVYAGATAFNNKATPYEMPENLEIPSRRSKDITFRMELNSTTVRNLIDHLSKSSPEIDILKGGSLEIKTSAGKNAIQEALEQPDIATVQLKIPGFSGSWKIRRFHTSNGKATTVREALDAIAKDFSTALGKTDLFAWSENNLATFSSVPFGKLDNTCRYITLLQAGKTISDELSPDQKLSREGCVLWIFDLENLEFYKNLPQALQKKIYEKIKAEIDSKQNPDVRVLMHMASFYLHGVGVEKDPEEAIKWHRKAAEQGHVYAQIGLGLRYGSGKGVKKNLKEAVKWYKMAAEQGEDIAQYALGLHYDSGEGVEKNQEEAVKWYRKAAEQRLAEAQFALGRCYYLGEGVEKNQEEAVKWYRKAAEQGHVDAQLALGACYYLGVGVEKNQEEAVKWYRMAAEQGHVDAQYNLGVHYNLGEGVEKNQEEAVKWYRKAAEQGHVDAQYNLGARYSFGYGVGKNQTEAVIWYRMAAEQGHAKAQYSLGLRYDAGEGVEKNLKEAAKWYRKAAEQGHVDAQYNLGARYSFGYGVGKNLTEAVIWYRMAAEQGHAKAQYSLGLRYDSGEGVEKNLKEAVKWYRKAAEQGLAEAKERLKELDP